MFDAPGEQPRLARIVGDHSAECVFLDSETMMVPDIEDQREIAIADWNARAVPAGHVVVPRELLERIRSQLDLRAEFDQTYPPETQPVNDDARLLLELRALLSEQDKRNRQGTLDSCYSGGSNETETIA